MFRIRFRATGRVVVLKKIFQDDWRYRRGSSTVRSVSVTVVKVPQAVRQGELAESVLGD